MTMWGIGSERRLLDTIEQAVESSCHPIISRSSTVEEPLPSIPAEAGEDNYFDVCIVISGAIVEC